ncbi:MAG: GAF domain-containing protein [Caldithrix sp.]|nr:GAF domain-containing protein [Caldithrix sp.]
MLNIKLSILIEMNQAVSRSLNLNESLKAALHILFKSYDIKTGAVFVLTDESLLQLQSAIGYAKETTDISYTLGEGIIGRVAETGRTIVVTRVSQEPLFRNKLASWNQQSNEELSFIAAPIAMDQKVLGVLAITLPYYEGRSFENTEKFIQLAASALLQPIRLRNEIELERERLLNENLVLKHRLQEEFRFDRIIGNSHAMREVYEMVAQVSQGNTTVLIRGESGTGKELIAQAIHYNSPRKDHPFISINCAAIPETLIESEFFGHEKGAFTGASATKKGRFEMAQNGTVFLDEIGDLSPMTQVKLLRFLQEKEFERVGGTQKIKVDVRIIAATNADLEQRMETNDFREDLYYRLNVFSIFLPPLRERKTDILLLADHFMLKFARQQGKSVRRISTPAIDMLMRYHWPGNVRELENCIERAVIVCQEQVIHSYHLPPTLQTAESSNTMPRHSLDEAVSKYEKELIEDALKSTRGNQTQAARLLDATERIIGYKIKKYGIRVKHFKR